MKSIIQRVHGASVAINNQLIAEITKGILAYVCFAPQDLELSELAHDSLQKMCDKLIKLRIFVDSTGKPNKSLIQIQGSLLLVPNFTLYANCKKGMRPSFSSGISPGDAKKLFVKFVDMCSNIIHTQTGIFGEKMCVDSSADGPFNIILET